MLVSDPGSDHNGAPQVQDRGRASGAVLLGLTLLFVGVLVLRNDLWNWDTPHPLLFGIVPVGLWWQGMVSILAALMMWLMVRLAWPHHLEHLAERPGPAGETDER